MKEGHGIDETHTGRQTLELEDFTPVTDLIQFETELMQRVDDGITVVPLEIMSKDGQRLFTALTPVLQLEQKLLDARVIVPPMEDVVVGALADQEIGYVSTLDLFGFNVKEHVNGRLHGVVVVVVVQRPNLNETLMGFNVHILLTSVTMRVPATMIFDGFGAAQVSATLWAFPSRLTDGAMILVLGSTVNGTRTVTFETSGPVKMTLTMRAQHVGRAVGPISGFVFVAVRLQTTATMFPFVPRASMLSLVIVPFETHEAEVRAPEIAFDRRERIVMVVVVEQRQKSVAVSVCHQRVGARGVDNDDLVVDQTRRHDHARQFVRSPSTGTESHFPGESFSGLLSTMHASSGIDPLFTSVCILTG